LIWRQAYIEALVWFDLMFDIRLDRSSRIDLVFASWSFERLSGFDDGPLLAAVGLVPSLCLPNILVFHH
jgi:hypothetical protein